MFHHVRSSGVRPEQIVQALRDVPNLALERWEEPLIEECAARHPDQNLVAMGDEEEILGALLGGQVFGIRCINHMGLVERVRRHGWGSKLAQKCVEEARGKCEVFYLITTRGNDDAARFWQRHGFTAREPALERDLESGKHYNSVNGLDPEADRSVLQRILEQEMPTQQHYVYEDLLAGDAAAFPLETTNGECCGLLLAGACGYRGVFRAILTEEIPTEFSADRAFQGGYAWMQNRGRYRIHNLWETPRERELVMGQGFTEEPTYICPL